MFLKDQLLCDKGKFQWNESSFVGHIIVIFVYKQINHNKVMSGSSQDSKHKMFILSRNSCSLGNILIISAL